MADKGRPVASKVMETAQPTTYQLNQSRIGTR